MEARSYQKTKDKMAIGDPHTSIITLNVNGLNSPIKRHRAQIGSKNKPNNMLPLGDIKAEKTKRQIFLNLNDLF